MAEVLFLLRKIKALCTYLLLLQQKRRALLNLPAFYHNHDGFCQSQVLFLNASFNCNNRKLILNDGGVPHLMYPQIFELL